MTARALAKISSTIAGIFALSFLLAGAAGVAAGLSHAAADPSGYLRHERFTMRVDGSEARSQLPLEPGHIYEIILSSSYSFKPLLDSDCTVSQRRFILRYTVRECQLPVLVNGGRPPTVGYHPKGLGLYFLDDTFGRHTSILRLYVWGSNRPLLLRTTADFSRSVPLAGVEVTDLQYRRDQEAQRRRDEQERERLEREREQAAELQQAQRFQEIQERAHRMRQAELAEEMRLQQSRLAALRAATRARITLFTGLAVVLLLAVVLIWIATADRRHKRRRARYRAARLAALRDRHFHQDAHSPLADLAREVQSKAALLDQLRQQSAGRRRSPSGGTPYVE